MLILLRLGQRFHWSTLVNVSSTIITGEAITIKEIWNFFLLLYVFYNEGNVCKCFSCVICRNKSGINLKSFLVDKKKIRLRLGMANYFHFDSLSLFDFLEFFFVYPVILKDNNEQYVYIKLFLCIEYYSRFGLISPYRYVLNFLSPPSPKKLYTLRLQNYTFKANVYVSIVI